MEQGGEDLTPAIRMMIGSGDGAYMEFTDDGRYILSLAQFSEDVVGGGRFKTDGNTITLFPKFMEVTEEDGKLVLITGGTKAFFEKTGEDRWPVRYILERMEEDGEDITASGGTVIGPGDSFIEFTEDGRFVMRMTQSDGVTDMDGLYDEDALYTGSSKGVLDGDMVTMDDDETKMCFKKKDPAAEATGEITVPRGRYVLKHAEQDGVDLTWILLHEAVGNIYIEFRENGRYTLNMTDERTEGTFKADIGFVVLYLLDKEGNTRPFMSAPMNGDEITIDLQGTDSIKMVFIKDGSAGAPAQRQSARGGPQEAPERYMLEYAGQDGEDITSTLRMIGGPDGIYLELLSNNRFGLKVASHDKGTIKGTFAADGDKITLTADDGVFAKGMRELGRITITDRMGVKMGFVKGDDTSPRRTYVPDPAPAAGASKTVRLGGHDWKVLDDRDGTLLVISEKILEKKGYHENYWTTTWEGSVIRKYLNGPFYDETFTAEEKERIVTSNIATKGNDFDRAGGDDTEDKIFLLSDEEAMLHLGGENARIACTGEGDAWWWWLRDAGRGCGAFTVEETGGISARGYAFIDGGIRPAMRIKRG